MDALLPLAGLRFSISGSAGDTASRPVDRALLGRCHAFVYHLTTEVLRAGGAFVVFVGHEPRVEPEDPLTAKVFSWTELEAIAAHLPARHTTHAGRYLLHAVLSADPAQSRIPERRAPLWDQLLEPGDAVFLTHIPTKSYFGGHHRLRQAEQADVLITLGGGKGVFDLDHQFRERGCQILPLDPLIGSSCNDGEASPELNREALEKPERFVPAALAAWFVGQLPRLSFYGGTSPEDLARRVLQVLVRLAPHVARGGLNPQRQVAPASTQSPTAATQAPATATRRTLPDPIHFLVLADEWWPYKGGISTFNRNFCQALTRAGHRVSLYIPRSNLRDNEREDIQQVAGIALVNSGQTIVTDERELLLRPALDTPPDVIVGHGAITGPAARIQRDHFSGSLLVHFIHVSPKDAEHEKGKRPADAMDSAEAKDREQADLAGMADLVVGLGPLLTRSVRGSLRHWRHTAPVHEMLPWLQHMEILGPPEEKACLFIGRAESYHLKGLSIAAGAVARLGGRPILYVRGATQSDADDLDARLKAWSHGDIRPHLRKYTVDQRAIDSSFLAATAVLMPSRTEGFGLAGLEAVMRGIPVLVGAESGLSEVLIKHGGELGSAAVVRFAGEDRDEENVLSLHQKLSAIWEKPTTAFQEARQLLIQLGPHLNEQKIITAFIEELRGLRR